MATRFSEADIVWLWQRLDRLDEQITEAQNLMFERMKERELIATEISQRADQRRADK